MKAALFSLALCAAAAAETVTLKATRDSDIYAFFDGPSFSVFDLNVGASGAEMAHSHHALVQFDLSTLAIPAGEIGSATLRLFTLEPDSANGGGLRAGEVAVHRQGAAWAVSGLKWSHLQPQEKLGVIPVTQDSANQWVELDVTSLAKSWAAGSLPNHGVVLKPESESLEPWLNVLFASMEITNFAPQLVISRAELPPVLGISVANGMAALEWPVAGSSGWRLQKMDPVDGTWEEVDASPVDDAGLWRVSFPVDPSGWCFFRLFKP